MDNYFTTRNVCGNDVVIYNNPTYRELSSIAINDTKEIRFLANALTQDIYAWNAFFAIHSDIVKAVNLDKERKKLYVLHGHATVLDGITKVTSIMPNGIKWNKLYAWSWLDKYLIGVVRDNIKTYNRSL
jgi:hypothetical protein